MRIVADLTLYCGMKVVGAAPMVMQEYFSQSGREIPEELDLKYPRDQPGYLVEYEPEKGEQHGYQSWSPAKPFEDAYFPIEGLPYFLALARCIRGAKIARLAWGGNSFINAQYPDENSKMNYPYLYRSNAGGGNIPWQPSNMDAFAKDWHIVRFDSNIVAEGTPIASPGAGPTTNHSG